MVSNISNPHFTGGANIAMKCPAHTYDATIAFYRDTLGLPVVEEVENGATFQFGPVRLWIDKVPNLTHPDIWLELATNDTQAADRYLKVHGIARRDEVEELHNDFDGFFISDPSGVVHLVVGEES
jgi:catechol 2,3-dioxygenase-like lactoylglutathione lyase family enzyme